MYLKRRLCECQFQVLCLNMIKIHLKTNGAYTLMSKISAVESKPRHFYYITQMPLGKLQSGHEVDGRTDGQTDGRQRNS